MSWSLAACIGASALVLFVAIFLVIGAAGIESSLVRVAGAAIAGAGAVAAGNAAHRRLFAAR